MKNKNIKRKKALSPVISTILLVLIAITAIVIVSSVVIPFVRNQLNQGKQCFETTGNLRINSENGFACFYNEKDGEGAETGNKIVNITISRDDVEISGIAIKVGKTSGKSFKIKQGETAENVFMANGEATLEIPGIGEDRTYSMIVEMDEVSYAEIYPLVGEDNMCDKTDEISLSAC